MDFIANGRNWTFKFKYKNHPYLYERKKIKIVTLFKFYVYLDSTKYFYLTSMLFSKICIIIDSKLPWNNLFIMQC